MEETYQWRSHERQYTLTKSTFIKSELPEDALPTSQVTGRKVYPQWSRERLENEAATLKFIASTTSIPVPRFLELYEENGLLHLVTERAVGSTLEDLASNAATKHVATKHVAECLETFILPQLHKLRHHTTGSIDANLPLIPPSRITYRDKRSSWSRKTSRLNDFVFCHNDLGQHNIFVDPDTFNITAIIDWEFAGYYTTEFEYPLWLSPYNEQGTDHLQTDHLIKFLDDTSECPKAADTEQNPASAGYSRFHPAEDHAVWAAS
ncbi:hypothetical protein BU26DRAFT_525217 [Trematosphaeria pertusa]|uniref:Aminoglycoside phosphotransferase domain-containing protein n=1 Tax=Trematosphaeria pertusa TaxID=390896 RepID=A0A6A6HTD9_9PLEO|nr:uncharacterized protein BU26DRAFT_525217 [Trematosphaeria pertusa]KAF2241386.1 hypothetical protein BU26DRAFT_525217 [Trematosphaeria pertusa]